MQGRSGDGWRHASDLVIAPNLESIEWNGFESAPELVAAGEAAARAALPAIQAWFKGPVPSPEDDRRGLCVSPAESRNVSVVA